VGIPALAVAVGCTASKRSTKPVKTGLFVISTTKAKAARAVHRTMLAWQQSSLASIPTLSDPISVKRTERMSCASGRAAPCASVRNGSKGPSHAACNAPPRLRIARCNGAQRLGVTRLQPRKTRGNDVRVVALRAAQAVAHRLRAAPVAVQHTVADRASSFRSFGACAGTYPLTLRAGIVRRLLHCCYNVVGLLHCCYSPNE
jgi:hypothetical protein